MDSNVKSRAYDLLIILLLALILLPVHRIFAEIAGQKETELVCRNWLELIIHHQGTWSGADYPRIDSMMEIASGDTTLAYCYHISPRGHIVVPVLKQLPPVKVYSDEYDLDASQSNGMLKLLRQVLSNSFKAYATTYGNLDAVQPPSGDVLFARSNRDAWSRLLVSRESFETELRDEPVLNHLDDVGPLLTTAWYQSGMYDDLCPIGDGGPCKVGCVATAAAQILRYHAWPPWGIGSHTYYWDGDQSCEGDAGGGYVSADFSDPYDWDNMPDDCLTGCTSEEEAELAHICFETGVGFDMDYGYCGSGAFSSQVRQVFPQYFRYEDSIENEHRSQYTAQSWFDLIRDEIDAGRPMLYSIYGHAIVCDGWRIVAEQNQYHINYGWGGSFTAWYAVDNIYGSQYVNMESLARNIIPECRFVVDPDGSGDYPTIQAAVDDLWNGCVIELTDGIFTGEGNRDIDLLGKSITIRSQSGNPLECIMDCEGTSADPHRGFVYHSGESSNSVIEGIGIVNGFALASSGGGGILCENSAPTISSCMITGAYSGSNGGGVCCYNSGPSLIGCVLANNTAADAGGAVCADSTSAVALVNCTIIGNEALSGGGLACLNSASASVENSIIAFSVQGEAVHCDGTGSASLACCDVYGNAGGDWTGCVAGQEGVNGNLSEDPLLCDVGNDRYDLFTDSPCAPAQQPECGLIGVYNVGCSSELFLICPDGSGDLPTIQAAVDSASHLATIELCNGIFTGAGNRDIDFLGKAITIRSQSGDPETCIIDCENAGRGFRFLSEEDHNSVLDGVTIKHGFASGTSPDNLGGGIFCQSAGPLIRNCIIDSCQADGSGGAIAIWSADPSMEECTFRWNYAERDGGAAHCYDDSHPDFTGCIFRYNSAGSDGGAVNSAGAYTTFANCLFLEDSAGYGGGALYAYSSSLTMENCIIKGNTANRGGGVHYYDGYISPFTNCLMIDNSALDRGGAVYSSFSSPHLTHCTLVNNTAPTGGGMDCEYSTAYFTGTIIAFSGGEGIYFRSNCTETWIEYCDIYGSSGGNIAFLGDDPSLAPEGIGELSAVNANGDSCDCYFNIFGDPLFADTTLEDYRLTEQSSCIGAAGSGDPPEFDFDGNPRPDPWGSHPDIGAFEHENAVPALPPVEDLIIRIDGSDVILNWSYPTAAFFSVYSDSLSDGDFTTFEAQTAGSTVTLPDAVPAEESIRYYLVKAEPPAERN